MKSSKLGETKRSGSAVLATCLSTVLLFGSIGCEARTQIREPTTTTTTHRTSSSVDVSTFAESNVAWPSLLGQSQDASIAAGGYDLRRIDGEPKPQWVVPLGSGYGAAAVDGEQVVVMGRDDDQEFVRCLSLNDGTVEWNHSYRTDFQCRFDYSSGPYSTPAISGDEVFAWSAEGTIRCLGRIDGQQRWSRDLREEYDVELGDFPLASSPVVDEQSVFINVGGRKGQSGVVAINRYDGQTRWTATTDAASHATPVIRDIDGQNVLFVLGFDFLTALHASSGRVFWQHEFHANNRDMGKFNSTSPWVEDRRVVVAGYAAGATSLDISDLENPVVAWTANRRSASNQMAPIVRTPNGMLFYGSDRKLTCLDPADGSVVFRERYEFGGEPQWFLCGSDLVVLGMNGRLSVLDTTSKPFAVRYTTQSPVVTPRCYTTPVAAGGRLLVRGQAELACYDISARRVGE